MDVEQTQEEPLIRARREKLQRWRDELGIEPYGRRVDGIIPLAEARAAFEPVAHDAHQASVQAARENPDHPIADDRPRVLVAGRCVQIRAMGKLVFVVLRDHSGDLQISVSKSAVDQDSFKIARKLDYGDIVVAGGAMGATQKGEICVWADRFEVHCKSLAPPPEKWHGLTDSELRYRQRYVDMYANPKTIATFQLRSKIVSRTRRFMEGRGFLEVETPMMQPIAGGAAARPFVTHHNALDMDLFLRIAPELYLKRLLVGGMPRVFEINRNFRNEGVDRSHNPEFTMLEVYEAFGDLWTMLELTESLLRDLAVCVVEEKQAAGQAERSGGLVLPFGEHLIDWSRPFDVITYGELFERALGFPMTDFDRVTEKARTLGVDNTDKLDPWLIVNKVHEELGEPALDPTRPTFVTDYPVAISPLTRPLQDNPDLAQRFELFIAGMELGNAYTELNDPDIQRARFTEQLAGADDEDQAFRAMDEDFVNSLCVGMPPAGGLGVGIDRVVMLLTNCRSIRDVILFPLLKPG